jgi:hypothetical protein
MTCKSIRPKIKVFGLLLLVTWKVTHKGRELNSSQTLLKNPYEAKGFAKSNANATTSP